MKGRKLAYRAHSTLPGGACGEARGRWLMRMMVLLHARTLNFTAWEIALMFTLYEAAGVANLWKIVTARSGHIDRLRKLNLPDPGKSTSILSCHERILAAIEAGDLPGVEAVVREHLSGTLAQVPKITEKYPEYF